jgi:hypothetical protein
VRYSGYNGKTTILRSAGREPGILRVPSVAELELYFSTAAGVRYDPKVHWCGIFQTYLLKKAGVNCHWDQAIVDDSGGTDLEISTGDAAKKGPAIGDIVRINHHQHHFTVAQPAERGLLFNIEGNWTRKSTDRGELGGLSKNIVEDICIRYRVVG